MCLGHKGGVVRHPHPAPVARYAAEPRRRRDMPSIGQETDSLLEGDGFEPSVPHKKQPFLAAPVRSRNSPSATKTGSFVPGTDGSNPSPSSEESGANLIFGEPRRRGSRLRDLRRSAPLRSRT